MGNWEGCRDGKFLTNCTKLIVFIWYKKKTAYITQRNKRNNLDIDKSI